jgi:hypothetical protein
MFAQHSRSPLTLWRPGPRAEQTRVAQLFFSDMNLEALQQGIRYRVYVDSDNLIVIGPQSVEALESIRRSIQIMLATCPSTLSGRCVA